MAISEEVKQDVANRTASLAQLNRKDEADIVAHQATIATLTARIAARTALIDKYDIDVPKPTPKPEEL